MTEDPFHSLAEKYDSWYEGKGKLAFESELAALRSLLPGLPKPWLEVGVGTGRFAEALGIEQGIDPSEELLRFARERGVNVVWGEGEEMPFPTGGFGTVFLLTTWAFLEDPAAVLRECRRVLKPSGVLVNGYLDRDGNWGKGYVERGRQGHELFAHARFASCAEVVSATEQAGFKVTGTTSALFSGPGEAGSAEEPRDGFVRGASFVIVTAERD